MSRETAKSRAAAKAAHNTETITFSLSPKLKARILEYVKASGDPMDPEGEQVNEFIRWAIEDRLNGGQRA